MLDRLIWKMWRRNRLALSIEGFHASYLSYATPTTQFAGYNELYRDSILSDVTLGLFSYVSRGARIINCKIGRFCCIGPETLVGGLGRHPTRWLSTHPVFYSLGKQTGGMTFSDAQYYDEVPGVVIGSDVWIGARAIVLDGVSIGDGAIIAAGAVVSKDVEPYSMIGGVPGRKIRSRYDESTVSRLLQAKWWDRPIPILQEMAPLFRCADAEKLLEALERAHK